MYELRKFNELFIGQQRKIDSVQVEFVGHLTAILGADVFTKKFSENEAKNRFPAGRTCAWRTVMEHTVFEVLNKQKFQHDQSHPRQPQ